MKSRPTHNPQSDGESTPTRKRRPPPTRKRLWLFRLLALCIPLLFFGALELGLRVAGTGYPTSFLVPHPTDTRYLVDNYKFAWRFFPRALARTPQPIVVQKQKPSNTVRIVVFGGSAAMGDPEPAFGMPRILEALLQHRFPKRRIEVVNCAVTAINSHVVRDIASDCRQLDADAWVVYMGNNEVHGPFGAGTVFGSHDQPLWLSRLGLSLQKTKIGQGLLSMLAGESSSGAPKEWGGMQMFLEQTLRYDDPKLEQVYSKFGKNLAAIVSTCSPNTCLLLSTVASNTESFAPFVSMHRHDLSDELRKSWQDAFQKGCDLQDAGDFQAALSAFQEAEKVESDYAELEYRQALCFQAIGNRKEAADKFSVARDHDGLRFRADTRINGVIRKTAADEKVQLVDIVEQLDTHNDADLFYEHVHFTFAGNYLVAKSFAQQLADSCPLLASDGQSGGAGEGVGGWLSQEDCERALGLSPFHQQLTLQDVRGRLNAPPFNTQFNTRVRDVALRAQVNALYQAMNPSVGTETINRYRQLITERPDDWHLRNQFAVLLNSMGQQAEAAEHFEAVAAALPHDATSQYRLGLHYNRMKQRDAAEQYLQRAIELRPDFARAHNSLGISLSHQGKFEKCYRHFAQAVAIRPSYDEAFVNWALVLANQGEEEAALEKLQLALAANADSVLAHTQLGKHFVAVKAFADAREHYEAVARLRPNDARAQLNLGMLYLKLGSQEELAKQQFLRTLKLNPGNPTAKEQLEALR